MVTKGGKKVVVKTLVVYKIPDPVRAIGKLNWDVDTTINDLTQSAVVRVIATHIYDEIMAGIRDESLAKTLTRETRRELRQFGVHVTRCKLVDFADCKVFKLLTSQADCQGMSSHQFYQSDPRRRIASAIVEHIVVDRLHGFASAGLACSK
jgi:hypothetical protein